MSSISNHEWEHCHHWTPSIDDDYGHENHGNTRCKLCIILTDLLTPSKSNSAFESEKCTCSRPKRWVTSNNDWSMYHFGHLNETHDEPNAKIIWTMMQIRYTIPNMIVWTRLAEIGANSRREPYRFIDQMKVMIASLKPTMSTTIDRRTIMKRAINEPVNLNAVK